MPAFAQEEIDYSAQLAKQKEKFEQRVGREYGGKLSMHETEHWLIASDAGEEEVKACGETLEKCYRLYFGIMKDIMCAKEHPEERMLAFIFEKDGPSRAYYHPRASAIFVSLHCPRGHRTLFHEATHQLQYERSAGRTPTWLVEGLAMYFESYVEIAEGRAQKIKGDVPIYLGDLKRRVREGAHVQVPELVGYSHEKFHSGDEHLNYCESGALVHFLIFGRDGAYREKFEYFLQGNGEPDLFAHLGVDGAALEKEFLAHVLGLANFTDTITLVFKERYSVAHEDVESPEFLICLARAMRLKGEFDESRRYLKEAAEKDREGKLKTRIRYNEGVTYYFECRWSDARSILEEVSQDMKESAQLFYFLADACRELNDFAAAEDCYEKSVKIEPGFFSARYELAQLYLSQGKTKKAIIHLEACTKLEPVRWTKLSEIGVDLRVSNIIEVLGMAYIQDGQYEKAAEALEKYASEEPTATGHYHLGLAYSKLRKKDKAVEALDTALALLKSELAKEKLRRRGLMPSFNTRVLNAIADLYVTLGEEKKALAALELLKKVSTPTPELHATLAKLYAREGKTDKAIEQIDEIAKLKPRDTFLLNNVAVALVNLKEYKASEHAYRKGLEIESENTDLLFNFGVLYWKWKKYGNALAQWEKALEIDPGFDDARKWVRKARKKLSEK